MKSRTLSKVTWVVLVWTIFSVGITATKAGIDFLTQFISSEETTIFLALPFFSLFYLFMSRVISYLGLSVYKGQSLYFLLTVYRGFYILLTDEARVQWREFIASEYERIGGKIK